MISGEDLEKSDEEEVLYFESSNFSSNTSYDGMTIGHENVIEGEAPEDSLEAIMPSNKAFSGDNSTVEFSNKKVSSSSFHPLDPGFIKRHKDKNKAFRNAITEKFLKPAINQGIQKMEKLSQVLSSHQSQMQDAVFQSKKTSTTMDEIMKKFVELEQTNYLKDIKIHSINIDSKHTTADNL